MERGDILNREFPDSFIKQRQGPGGITLDYVEAQTVIGRLNEAFAYQWDFEIVEWRHEGNEVIVLGKLTADGTQKMQFGSKIMYNEDATLGDALKAAASDAIKKCATLLGVGLHLYGDIETPSISNKQQQEIATLLKKLGKTTEELEAIFPRLIHRQTTIPLLTAAEANKSINFLRKKIEQINPTCLIHKTTMTPGKYSNDVRYETAHTEANGNWYHCTLCIQEIETNIEKNNGDE